MLLGMLYCILICLSSEKCEKILENVLRRHIQIICVSTYSWLHMGNSNNFPIESETMLCTS